MAYPNNWVDAGKVWVYYNITDISAASSILNQTTGLGSTMNVDGTDVPLANSYQFSATGEHLIKYGFSGSSWGQQLRNKTNFTKVFFPSNVTTVGSQAFQGTAIQECYGEGVTTIGGVAAGWGGGAFTQVTSLTLLDFPNLTKIDRGGCYQCTNLETLNGLENVTTLVGYGIAQCSKLRGAITFKLTELPNPGLNDLGFTHIYLPNVVTSNGGSGTGNNGIGACHSLQYVEFGTGITSIGGYNLGHCENLKKVVIRATTPPTLATGFLYGNSSALIYVPAESVQAYKEASGWSSYASRIYAIGDEKRLNINHLSLGDFRRRIMLGISRPKASLYPPDYVDDGKIWAYISVPEAGTYRISDGYMGSWFNDVELDGVSFGNYNRDQTLPQGEHIIKYTLKNTSVYPAWSRGLSSIFTLIIMPSTITQIDNYSFYGSQGAVAKVLMDKSKIVSIGDGCFFHSTVDIGNVDFPVLQSLTNAFNDYYRAGQCIQKNLGMITTITSQAFRGCIFKDKTYRIPATVTSIGDLAFYNNSYDLIYYLYPPTPPTLSSQWVFRAPAAIYVPAESVQAYKEAAGWSTYANKIQAIPE